MEAVGQACDHCLHYQVLGSGLTVQLERVVGVPGLAGLDRLLGLMLVTRCLCALPYWPRLYSGFSDLAAGWIRS